MIRMKLMMKASLALVALAAIARGAEISLPQETTRLAESPLPGYGLTVSLCSMCHSADYITYQPPSSRAYWQGAVVKMQKTFGAPIPESAIAPIAEYLAKTYGTERTGGSGASPARSTTSPTTPSGGR